MTDRKLDTAIAALRYWQREVCDHGKEPPELFEIARDSGRKELSGAEINDLVWELNKRTSREKIEIHSFTTISSAHITQEDSELLNDNSAVASDEYGHFLLTSSHLLAEDDSDALEIVLQWCPTDWLRVDQDGPRVPGLPSFNW
jgi:hypothetical protein